MRTMQYRTWAVRRLACLVKVLSMIIVTQSALTSCSDDDATYTATVPLEITASDLLFSQEGGTGYIQVEAIGGVTAQTDNGWIILTVEGNRIVVAVPQNVSIDGRSAKINVTADGKSASVVVTQRGMVFAVTRKSFWLDSDSQQTLVTDVEHLVDVTVSTDADWITPSFDAATDKLAIHVAENSTGNIRQASVNVTSAGVTERVVVTQYELARDIYGYYSLDYYTKEGEAERLLVQLQEEQVMRIYLDADNVLRLPVGIDTSTGTVSAETGQYIGTYAGAYYVYMLVGEQDRNSELDTFRDEGATTTVVIAPSQTSTGLKLTGTFGGKWESVNSEGKVYATHIINMWGFDAYTSRTISDRTHYDMILKCCRPSLVKLSDADGAAWLAQY